MDTANMALIGSGAQADVYLSDENKAIKLFKPGYAPEIARFEAEIQGKAHKAGLPVPEIFEVKETNGRTAIIMEYISGKTFGDIMLADAANLYSYMSLAVELQIKVHAVDGGGFPMQREKLENCIMNAPYLENMQKRASLDLLQGFESDGKLCHGDLHVFNLIQTNRDIKIIDWVDASNGSIAADVCRSYMLYLCNRADIAEVYLEIYCKKANLARQKVLKWLPVIASARLSENISSEDEVTKLLNVINC